MDIAIGFGCDFDGGAWPGPLQDRRAVAGEIWLGPKGLLDFLETRMGLGGAYSPDPLRAAALMPALRDTEGFWSASAKRDPLAAAEEVLRWRDQLWLYGWRGEPASRRLKELAEVTAGILAGSPDRLDAIAISLMTRSAGISRVVLHEEPHVLGLTWSKILGALERQGTAVTIATAGAEPATQCSIQFLRPTGVLAAAEQAAAWLAAQPSLAGVVIVSPDPVLDSALHRFGLPTTGAMELAPDANALLQVLPLVIAMGWKAADPQRALELLTLPQGPVPKGIAKRLVEALHQWPALDSDLWRDNLSAGLDRVEDPTRGEQVANRLQAIFAGEAAEGAYPTKALQGRINLVRPWLHGRLLREPDRRAAIEQALAQANAFERLLEAMRLSEITDPLLRRLLAEATTVAGMAPRFPAEAGLAMVGSPGALVGPARHVIWWNFVASASTELPRAPWTTEEREALARVGVLLPETATQADGMAARWARPVAHCQETLLLFAPRLGPEGDELLPHPLLYELEVPMEGRRRVEISRLAEPLAGSTVLPKVKAAALEVPAPLAGVKLEISITPQRKTESASSLQKLVECPLAYVLEYIGGIRKGATAALPEGPVLWGNLAHELLRRVLAAQPDTPEDAKTLAEALFDSEGPRLAGTLFLPGRDAERSRVRLTIAKAARALVRSLQAAGATELTMETEVVAQVPELAVTSALSGTPDLVVGSPLALLDLKWSSESQFRDRLKAGTAHQLAVYAELLRQTRNSTPQIGYFVIQRGHMLTTEIEAFAGADERISGPSLQETWSGLVAACGRRQDELRDGRIEVAAPADPSRKNQDALADGVLVLQAKCKYCDYQALCGRLFGEGEEE